MDNNHMDALQNATVLLLKRAVDGTVDELASAVDKATNSIRLSAELDKAEAETRKLALEESKLRYDIDTAAKRERSDRIKDYGTLLAPIISIVALAATVFLQAWQFQRSETDKAEQSEDARWQDAVKMIQETNHLLPGVIALSPFLRSVKYGDPARDEAITLLASGSDIPFLTSLFGAAFVPARRSDLGRLVELDRAFDDRDEPLLAKTYDPKLDRNDNTKLDAHERASYDYLTVGIEKVSVQVGTILKSPRPAGVDLDLSAARFSTADWKGADLSAADIHGTLFNHVDLKGADLSRITRFQGSNFYRVAWWEASRISPELLEFLKADTGARYRSDVTYGSSFETVTPDQYQNAVTRLAAAAGSPAR